MRAAEDGRGAGRVCANDGTAKTPSASAVVRHPHATGRVKVMAVLLTTIRILTYGERTCPVSETPPRRSVFLEKQNSARSLRLGVSATRQAFSVQPERQQQIPCGNRHNLFAVDEIADRRSV